MNNSFDEIVGAKRVIRANIVDIVSSVTSLTFCALNSEKNLLEYYSFNVASKTLEETEENVYLLGKFGVNYQVICAELKDFLSCDTVIFDSGDVYVVYPTGEVGHFDKDGMLVSFGFCFYDDAPIRDCVPVGNNFFSLVPGRNAFVRYNTALDKIDMRIGGDDETRLNMPISAFVDDDGELYINNRVSKEILVFNTTTFEIKDKFKLSEPANKFYLILGKKIAVFNSGIYLVD